MKWLNKMWIVGLMVLLTTSLVSAELITIQIEGVVDYVNDPGGYLEGNVIQGETFSGTYTYDTDTPDSASSYPNVGEYWHYSQPCGIIVDIGGFEFKTDPSDVEFYVAIANDQPWEDPYDNQDVYILRSYNNSDLSNGVSVAHILWQLEDDSGQAIDNSNLPLVSPVLDDWDSIFGLSIEGGKDNYFFIKTTVTSAVIPEPSSILLISLGAMWLRIHKRKI